MLCGDPDNRQQEHGDTARRDTGHVATLDTQSAAEREDTAEDTWELSRTFARE